MPNRTVLIILQALGALSILPYPFVLIANVMSIAAPGQTAIGAAPFILLSIYPIIFIALDVLGWRMLARGSTGWAFALSSIPALVTLAGYAFLTFGGGNAKRMFEKQAEGERAAVEPANPLLWTIMCTGGKILRPGAPEVTVDQAITAIDANPSLVNVAVAPYGRPLRVALQNAGVGMKWDGVLGDRNKDLARVVRALIAHGAQLGVPDPTGNLWPEFVLKRLQYDGPINTETENRLTWRVLHREYGKLFEIGKDELPLLNKAVPLHGTPLNAVLLIGAPDLFQMFVQAGARLTPEEERDPATAAALDRMFQKFPELKNVYWRR